MNDDISKHLFELQTCLMNINEENIVETSSKIIQTIFIQKEYIQDFAECIFTAVDYRPNNIRLYSKLLLPIYDYNSTFMKKIKPFFLKNVFSDDEKKKGRLFFIYNCYVNQLIDIDDIKYVFTHPSPPDTSIQSSFNSLYFFCWFAPELEEHDPYFYEITLKWFIDASKYIRLMPKDLKFFCSNLSQLKNKNWKKLRQYRLNNSINDELAESIKNDDLDIFTMLYNSYGFDINKKIEPSIFDIHWIIGAESPTLFEYSAYFGAVKIFKYIFMNFLKEDKISIDRNKLNVIHYSIAGGSIEIVKTFFQNHYDFFGGINIAALFHRNEIFDWLLSQEDTGQCKSSKLLVSTIFGKYGSVIMHALKSYNYYVFDLCLKENSIKKNLISKMQLLKFVLAECHLEVINFFLNQVSYDLTSKIDNESVIYDPIVHGKIEIVKLLVSKEPKLINCTTQFELPIWTAARYGKTEIVNFLSSQPEILISCNKKSFLLDPFEDSEIPFRKTTNVVEFSQYQSKRWNSILKKTNPFFIGIA